MLKIIFIVLFVHGIHRQVLVHTICRYFYNGIKNNFHSNFYILNLYVKIFIFIQEYQNFAQHPCLRNTRQLLEMNIDQDYDEILNIVQRHTICREGACLKKKRTK